ncbi:unnamed protein product [Auanema sp. JU1783]|nr:unnamed protein product [Auanema sp. JU1783]
MQFCRLLRFKHTNSSRCFFNKTFAEAKTISTGLFGNSELKTPADFKKLNENVRKNCSCIVREIMSGSENKTTVQLLDDLSNEICKAADLTECIRQLHSDPKFTAAAEESARDFCQLVESLNTYTELYEKLNQSKNQEINRLSDVDKRTLDLFLDDFQQSGVHLPQNKREKFVQLSEEIFDAGARYQWGCDHEVEVTSDKKKYGLHSTKLFSPVVDTFNNEVRKFVYTSFYQHNKNQENSLRTLVSKRHELAQLTGFETFSHRAQHNTLMGSYDNAKKFLWGIIEACRHSAEKEITVLLDVLGQCEPGHQRVAEWDIGFLSRIYKERAFGRSHHEAVTKYLKLGNVLRSFDNLIEKLYGIRFEQQNSEKGELWHSSVLKFAATDSSTGRLLGQIYMDIERRSTKAVGDCHYTVRCSKEMANGDWQTPIVVLSLSLTDVRKTYSMSSDMLCTAC